MESTLNLSASDACDKADGIFNLTNPVDADDILYGPTDRFLMSIVVPAISAIGVIGNGAFLYTSVKVAELRNDIITAFLANLAICDILFLVSSNIWFAIIILSTSVNIAFPVNSTFGCAVSVVSVNWWYFTSLGLVTLITVERYVAICMPITHLNIKGKTRTIRLLSAIWILAFIITVTGIPQNGKFTKWCVLWPDLTEYEHLPLTINDCEPLNVAADIYGSCLVLISLVITLLINVVLYVKIVRELKKRTIDQALNQITRTLIINGIIFFICQLPYRIWVLDDVLDLTGQVDLIGFELESLTLTVGRACLILNSIVNPFIYVFTCRHYRRAMIKAFCGDRCSNSWNQTSRRYQQDELSNISSRNNTNEVI